jgi:folate-dependent tRNA-U54 methylase TrmFO/GidA
MSGLVSALSVFATLRKRCLPVFPKATLIGSLMSYLHTSCENFQPMNAKALRA